LSSAIEFDGIGALLSVVIIDVVLAGDNAIVVGIAAAGLPREHRRRVVIVGIAMATLLRIALAGVAISLLEIIGLMLAGGILLLWVAWKLYRELRAHEEAEAANRIGLGPAKTFARAVSQIVLADVSMSLDNVLAIAGTARDHRWVLVAGLALSVALMGLASDLVARLVVRYRIVAWLGLVIVAAVALRMIYDGSSEIMRHPLLRSLG
jgi:YjbE family integral membrane protein